MCTKGQQTRTCGLNPTRCLFLQFQWNTAIPILLSTVYSLQNLNIYFWTCTVKVCQPLIYTTSPVQLYHSQYLPNSHSVPLITCIITVFFPTASLLLIPIQDFATAALMSLGLSPFLINSVFHSALWTCTLFTVVQILILDSWSILYLIYSQLLMLN